YRADEIQRVAPYFQPPIVQSRTAFPPSGRKTSAADARRRRRPRMLALRPLCLNVSLPNKMQMAFGVGNYDVPGFLVEGDDNFDAAQWEARVTSVQVFRTTYRFRGPGRSGPALGGVILNQNWRLQSAPLNGQTTFREISAGVTGGYYLHIGRHFYVYPTAAYTYNNVYSGDPSIKGTTYKTDKFS